MNVIDIMKRPAAYASGYENIPGEEQNRAKQLCSSIPIPFNTRLKIHSPFN